MSPLALLPVVTVSPAATVPRRILAPQHQGVPRGLASFDRIKGRGHPQSGPPIVRLVAAVWCRQRHFAPRDIRPLDRFRVDVTL